ncbi:hypothetical protein TNCV_2740511 [Trichonephila clavipes]|nr:hypothetical protein TNCV_2740511 [Trichonephila clavipes]
MEKENIETKPTLNEMFEKVSMLLDCPTVSSEEFVASSGYGHGLLARIPQLRIRFLMLLNPCLEEGLIHIKSVSDQISGFSLDHVVIPPSGLRVTFEGCQVIYSQFGLAIHQNDHQARRRFVEWVQNEVAVVPDFHKRILFSDEAHFWLNGYVNKQNCRIWSEANPQVYVETPLHPEKLTVWCALWAGGILLQKR